MVRLEHADIEVSTNFLWQVVTGSIWEVSWNNHQRWCLFFRFWSPVLFHGPVLVLSVLIIKSQGSRKVRRYFGGKLRKECKQARLNCSLNVKALLQVFPLKVPVLFNCGGFFSFNPLVSLNKMLALFVSLHALTAYTMKIEKENVLKFIFLQRLGQQVDLHAPTLWNMLSF